MRIISPFHDYYDTALGLGYDPSLIYRREVAVKNVRASDLDSKISTLLSEACRHYRFESKLAIIGFCGRVYPVYLFPTFIPGPELLSIKHPKNLAMTRTELTAYHKELYGSDRAWYERSYGNKTWDVLDKQGIEIRQKSFQLVEAPIWLAMMGEYEWNEPKMIRIFTNVRLANFEFQKHFDAFTAFQEISMFFGSALAKTDESVRTVGSDEIISAQKGFGPESFRTNAPSLKKSRRKREPCAQEGRRELRIESEFDALYKHIKRGRIDKIEEYLAQGGDPNLRNGWTLLMVAAHFGNTPILTLLLDHGARIDAEGRTEDLTPLAMAASQGKRKCVSVLLERGANADVRPHGLSLDTYIQYCGGPYPQVDKLLAAYRSS